MHKFSAIPTPPTPVPSAHHLVRRPSHRRRSMSVRHLRRRESLVRRNGVRIRSVLPLTRHRRPVARLEVPVATEDSADLAGQLRVLGVGVESVVAVFFDELLLVDEAVVAGLVGGVKVEGDGEEVGVEEEGDEPVGDVELAEKSKERGKATHHSRTAATEVIVLHLPLGAASFGWPAQTP